MNFLSTIILTVSTFLAVNFNPVIQPVLEVLNAKTYTERKRASWFHLLLLTNLFLALRKES